MDKSTPLPASKAKPSKTTLTSSQVIHKAIKKAGGLSDWDDEGIAAEVKDITKALHKAGFEIVRRLS